MNKRRDFLFIFLFLFALNINVWAQEKIVPYGQGETVRYTVKSFLGVKAGEAELVYHGRKVHMGREVILITFTSKGLNFFDEEFIYADKKTLFPLVVERNLNIFGKKEKIIERYSHKKGTITIIKKTEKGRTTQVIEKEGQVDNIYCFIYRYRKTGHFQVGDSFLIPLPTKDMTIELMKTTKLRIAGKAYDTYYMQSNPAQYRIWFDQSGNEIPLRIDGSAGLMKMVMVMKDYSPKETMIER